MLAAPALTALSFLAWPMYAPLSLLASVGGAVVRLACPWALQGLLLLFMHACVYLCVCIVPGSLVQYFHKSFCEAVNPESSQQAVYLLCESAQRCADGQHTLRAPPFHSIWSDLLLLAWLWWLSVIVKYGREALEAPEGGDDARGSRGSRGVGQQAQASRQEKLAAARRKEGRQHSASSRSRSKGSAGTESCGVGSCLRWLSGCMERAVGAVTRCVLV
jgi:hypothetical protein